MADFQKRAKQTRKQAAKRATKTKKRARAGVKTTRKAVGKTSTRTRAQAVAAFGIFVAAAAAVGRVLKGGKDEQRYTSAPDNLPNTPAQPAATTPPPGAGTPQTGSDTGTTTETERARVEQASS